MGINSTALNVFGFLGEAEFDRTRGFIGLGIVCAVLLLAWGIYALLSHLKADTAKNVRDTEKTVAPHTVTRGMSEEIIAAISAAIFMAESESDGELKFRVVSFRRK